MIRPGEARPPGGATGAPGSRAVWVLSVEGRTLFDAARRAALESSRRINWTHSWVTVIGQELAGSGIAPFLDFLDHDPEPRRLAWVLVAKGRAEDILKAEHELEKISGKALDGLVKARVATSFVPAVRLHDFLLALSTEGREPFAPGVEVVPLPEPAAAEGEAAGDAAGKGGGGAEGSRRFTFVLAPR